MKNTKSYINIELDKKLRWLFKVNCKSQGITMQKAIPLLMQKVVDGEIGFSPIKRDVLVLKKR